MKKLLVLILALALCLSTFASCGDKQESSSELEDAINFIFQTYKDDAESTPKDYDVMGKVPVGEKFFPVTWTVDVTEGVSVKESAKEGFYTIDVDEKSEKEIPYKLTATVTDEDGNTASKEFSRKVPAYKVASYQDYVNAEEGASVTVTGIITGIMAKSDGDKENSVFVQDSKNEGGYYIYGLEQDPATELNLKVGMTVEAVGNKTNYNGTLELKSASITVVDSTIKTVTPVDYTEIFKAAEKTDDANLVAKQALLVTIKGVEVTGQDTGSGYYKFKLDGVESYVRISSSSNCTTKAEAETMKANHTEKKGYTADVTGIVQIYSGAFYLIPVSADAFANFNLGEKAPADQITHELGKLDIASEFAYNKELTLPLKGVDFTGVTLSYAITGNCLTYDAATGKLTVNVDATDKKGTITVTAKVDGAADVTKTIEVSIVEPSVIFDAVQKADGEEVTVKGIVINVKEAWNDQYGNTSYTIMDDAGRTLYIYRTKLQAEVGDFVTITGKMATYGGARQIGQGSTGEKGTADDKHKAMFELSQINIDTSYSADVNLTLPATKTMYDATIAWTKGDEAITTLTVAQTTETQTINLKVSVTVGTVTLTKDFEIKVMAKTETLATFNFGANVDVSALADDKKHNDGKPVAEEGKTYTEGNYSLTIPGNSSKVYEGANDKVGNSCIKMGTSSVAGEFSFTVGADVNQVVIKIAGYKKNAAKVSVNGVEYTVEKQSEVGEYMEITVDTSETKTVTVKTLAGGLRAMIDSITYKG